MVNKWAKKIALRYGNEFGVNIVSVYTERGLIKRVRTMNRRQHGITGYKQVDKVNREWKLRITRTYKQIRDRAMIEKTMRQQNRTNNI